jgi:hypothetical protein
MNERLDLNSLLMAFFDTGDLNFLSISETNYELFNSKFIDICFTDRPRFSRFIGFIDGNTPSWLEDDHNIFDLTPYLEDIGHSDMVIRLNANTVEFV